MILKSLELNRERWVICYGVNHIWSGVVKEIDGDAYLGFNIKLRHDYKGCRTAGTIVVGLKDIISVEVPDDQPHKKKE